jgi:catechol 2,3-dioxygenase-like lactoylglutathione lyase family enzyme
MEKFYARSVFFVNDAERSLKFYTETLGFSLDWKFDEAGKAYIFQVSLFGFEVIINQTGPATQDRAGRSRVFVGLEDAQSGPFHDHIRKFGIATTVVSWGEPTVAIYDPDGNELFFWLPEKERAELGNQGTRE